MRFIVALWRFAIAGFCFVGTYEAWSKPQFWVYFTFQTGFVLGIVMLWSGAATLLKGIQPPAWLKGVPDCVRHSHRTGGVLPDASGRPGIRATGYWHHDQYDAAQNRPDYGGYRFRAIRPAPAFPLALHVLVAGVLPCILGLRAGPCGDLAGVRTGGRRQSVSVRLHQPRRTRLARVRH